MKKIIMVTFLVTSLFIACSKMNEPVWVNANNGLSLKEEPSAGSKQIELIPDGEQVIITKMNKEEAVIDNIKGSWVKIKWKDKTGWAFNGFLSKQNFSRWITAKTGLPFYGGSYEERGLIPFKERVKFTGPSKLKDYVTVLWKGKNVDVRGEFLSETSDISYNYPDLRAAASKKHAYDPAQAIYPEDLYIENSGWLYHIIYIYKNQEDKKDYLQSLWYKDGSTWKEIEINGSNHESFGFKMFSLDEDDNPDIMVYGGCCDSYSVEFFLGSADKKLNSVFAATGVEYSAGTPQEQKSEPDSPIIISTGKCGQTVIEFKGKKNTFDCRKKEFI